MIKTAIKTTLALALCTAAAVSTYAAIIVDGSATGFVGKGDIQLAFGWSNAQLQSCANQTGGPCLSMTYEATSVSTSVTESDWTCTKAGNPNIQERERTVTTTTSTSAGTPYVSTARVKNQVTGFNLSGGSLVTSNPQTTTTAEGPALNSCPTGWTLSPAGNATTVSNDDVTTRKLIVTANLTGASVAQVRELPIE